MLKHWERCLPTMKVKSFSNFYLAQSAVQAFREFCRSSRFEQFTALYRVSGH